MGEKKAEEKAEKPKKRGICGNCPVGLGYPVCGICAIVAALIAYTMLT